MSGKTILLTGASSGMGRLIAETLAKQGHQVFAGMRNLTGRNAPRAMELAAIEAPVAITPVDLDVIDDASVQRCVADVLGRAGQIDVLINCAGVMWVGTTEAFAVDQFEALMQTNVMGPFRLYKAVLPGMRARNDGLLITVTSTCGRIIPPNFGIYAASKFGLEALAESIAYETSDLGIRSIILEPGAFNTGLMGNQVDPRGADVVAEYGEMGQFDRRLSKATAETMQSQPDLYDPQIVADAVAAAIAAPKGSLPLRQPLGRAGAVPELNRQIATAQAGFLSAVGLGHLAEKDLAHG